MWSHGTFYWNELMTRDAARVRKFYSDTVGWAFDSMQVPNGTYWVARMGANPVAGILTMSGPEFNGVPEQWMSYLAVDDVDARVDMAVAGGATVLRPAFDVPGVGRIVVLRPPGGAIMSWITPSV